MEERKASDHDGSDIGIGNECEYEQIPEAF